MKLRYIVLFSLLFSCMLVTSVSYAWTIDDFFHYTNIVHNTSGISDKLYYGTKKVLDNETAIRNIFNQHSNNITTITCGIDWIDSNTHNTYLGIYLDYAGNININSSRAILNASVGVIRLDSQNGGKPRWSNGSSNNQCYSNNCYGLVDSSQTIPSQYFINNYWVPPYNGPVFTPVNNGSITVYNSLGVSDTFLRRPFYPNGQKYYTLGYITDYEDVYALNGYFGAYIYASGDSNIIDSYQNTFNYNDYNGTYNKNLCFDSSTGEVYIDKNVLLNMQGYNLYLTYQMNYGDNNTDTFYEGNFYTYYGNTFPSSGDVISPNLNSTTDIGWINAFGDLTTYDDVTKENVDHKLDTLFGIGSLWSGDIFSGDLLGNLGYTDYYNNDYSLFIYSIYRNVLDIFSSTTMVNEGITVGVHNWSTTIYPSDFLIPNGPIKTFINLYLVTGIVILLVQQFHSLMLKLSTMDLIGTVKSFDRQHTFFM